jgi:hypothetical protein
MDLAIPWRTTAIVASAVAALELVGLLVLGAVLLGGSVVHRTHERTVTSGVSAAEARSPQSSHSRLPSTPHVARVPRSRTHVLVLNGNGRQGAAGAEASTLRRFGYRISGTRNAARMDYPATIVMYRPGYRFAATRLARDSAIRAVRPLDGLRPAQLHGSQVAVIVGG